MNPHYFRTPFTLPSGITALSPQPLCSSDAPLVLLPVRIETRFFPAANAMVELRVRIYPDKIHAYSHEATLPQVERDAAMAYWREDWRCGNSLEGRKLAWCALADRFGDERAAWIARALKPTNAHARPSVAAPAGQEPNPAPSFPALPPADANAVGWQEAATARLLPDHWIVCVHAGGAVVQVTSGPVIRQRLAVGPDPKVDDPDPLAEPELEADVDVAVDPGMRWMVDFTEAQAAGMAVNVLLPQATVNAGLDSVVVFGVAASQEPAAARSALADLLDGHHYTDGLEFLRQGTPTNNTSAQRSGHRSRDPQHAASFACEVLAAEAVAQPGSNAVSLGRMLGLDDARIQQTLASLGSAGATHDRDQRSMNTALWQVGWGYFLSNMIGPAAGPTPAQIDWARQHFIDHVRAAGLLPPLRVGRQPYGILPVTSLNAWVSDSGASDQAMEQSLRALLQSLRDNVWRPVCSKVARIGLRQSLPDNPGAAPDPDSDLVDVMSMDAVSHRLRTRGAFGRHFFEHLHAIGAKSFGALLAEVDGAGKALLQQLGLLTTPPGPLPRLASMFFDDRAHGVSAPWVQADAAHSALQPNYISALLADRKVQTLLAARPNAQTSVLQALLRHAALREIADATARIAAGLPGGDLYALLRERELIDLIDPVVTDFKLGPPAQTEHWRRQLERVVPAVTGTATIRQYLDTLPNHEQPAVRALGEFYGALGHLASQPADALELLLKGTLDLGSYRLDAWITSLANKRLSALAQTSQGIRVGAYGWVENLRPAAAPANLPPASLPPDEPGPMRYLPNDSGFIHAPSLTHASAAALLRNAHLGPAGQPTATDPFAIDLSSRRARKAIDLLRGVQRGQPLGVLLGYDFERGLQERGLDRFIQPLRALSPQSPIRPVGGGAAAADTHNVVDGLALLRRHDDPNDTAIDALFVDSPAQAQQVVSEIESLRDSVDGMADALTAETAFQLARGNSARITSTLESLSRGESVPGQLEVLHTPRSGKSATHRVLCLMSGGAQTASGWVASAASPAANVERMLNAWVSRLLCDPRLARVTAATVDTANGQTLAVQTFPLSELGLTPLDFVLGVEAQSAASAGPDAASRVERLAEYHATRRAQGVAPSAQIRLVHERPSNLGPTEVTLFDMLEQARAIRRLLNGSRAVRPQDLLAASASGTASIDIAELETRAVSAEAALTAARVRLANVLAPGATANCESLRTAILSVGAFALSNTVPGSATGESPEALDNLRAQAKALMRECDKRIEASSALRSQPAPADPSARAQRLAERAQAALGGSFLLLPKIALDATAALQLQNALAATATLAGDAAAPYTWFTRHARVRGAVAELAACTRMGEILGAAERLSLRVAQLPHSDEEAVPWVGLPLPAGTKELPDDRLSLVVQSVAALNTSLPLCGIWVDEWVEVTPGAEETSALAFQYNPPNATAPQCVLVAVPPVKGQNWTVESLRQVLVETLDLAKLRAVEPALLGDAAQYLPATYLALNAADDAVSTDFAPLTP
jgi:hypothetical protein